MKVTYYEIEWTDADRSVHTDYFIPQGTGLASVSYMNVCEDVDYGALQFVHHLMSHDLYPFKVEKKTTEVKVER